MLQFNCLNVFLSMNIKFIDLFAWVWWFHLALENLWAKCVSAVEIDHPARKTYTNFYQNKDKELFEKNLFFWDIREVKAEELPECNIMCGWFPCQAFSIAWYRKGFEDDRWNLFFEIARLAKIKKPDVLFLENVKNLTAHDWWNTFKVIVWTLEDMWYHVKHRVLNSCEYWWVPQNRERIYIVAFKNKKHYDKFDFPEPLKRVKPLDEILEKWKVDNKYYYNWKPLYDKLKDEVTEKWVFYQWRRIYVRKNKSWVCPTLTANMWTWWHNVPIILDDYWIRKLTPKETFRLQWFDSVLDNLPMNLPDSQLYKQAGNAVTVWTVQRIAKNIIKSMED